jgi:hypothetical protein
MRAKQKQRCRTNFLDRGVIRYVCWCVMEDVKICRFWHTHERGKVFALLGCVPCLWAFKGSDGMQTN